MSNSKTKPKRAQRTKKATPKKITEEGRRRALAAEKERRTKANAAAAKLGFTLEIEI